MKFIFIDTETGGIGLDKSLLTLSLVVTNQDLEILEKQYYSLKPDDGVYHVDGKALAINKIDLAFHDLIAMPYKTAKSHVYNLIHTHSNEGADKLIPAGHGVSFDLIHIWDKLISRNSWENCCSYRPLDTGGIARFLMLLGKLPADLHGSLTSICEYFNIPLDPHHAENDNLATIEVLKAEIALMKNN
jgi:DNA polymerase III epsilon subunit-like protein